MEPKFNPPQGGCEAELLCPACGSNYLHHEKIEIFERDEDKSNGVHVTVENGQAIIDTNLTGNPSMRRHGIKVSFWCEGCSEKSSFELGQHKGNTEVSFHSIEKT